MKSFLEKGYGWPLMVVALLVSSVVMMMGVVMAARSDGGAQVLDNYYEQAVQWDSIATVRDAAQLRGWTASLQLDKQEERVVGFVSIADSSGVPISREAAQVRLSRPQYSETVANIDATWDDEVSAFRFSSESMRPGLWDIHFVVMDQAGPVRFDWRRQL